MTLEPPHSSILRSRDFWLGLGAAAIAISPVANLVFVQLWEWVCKGYINVGMSRWFEWKEKGTDSRVSSARIDSLVHGGKLHEHTLEYARRRGGSCALIAQANLGVVSALLVYFLFVILMATPYNFFGFDLEIHNQPMSFDWARVGVFITSLLAFSTLLSWGYRRTNIEVTRVTATQLSDWLPRSGTDVGEFITWRQTKPCWKSKRSILPWLLTHFLPFP